MLLFIFSLRVHTHPLSSYPWEQHGWFIFFQLSGWWPLLVSTLKYSIFIDMKDWRSHIISSWVGWHLLLLNPFSMQFQSNHLSGLFWAGLHIQPALSFTPGIDYHSITPSGTDLFWQGASPTLWACSISKLLIVDFFTSNFPCQVYIFSSITFLLHYYL